MLCPTCLFALSIFDLHLSYCFSFSCRVYFNLLKLNVVPFSPIISETVKAPTHLLENFRQVPLVEVGLLMEDNIGYDSTIFLMDLGSVLRV
jgi:hypothetical protein